MLTSQHPRSAWKVEIVLAFFLSTLVFCLGLYFNGPVVFPDEPGYIANAAALAGYPNHMASSYHAGYSLFLTPAFWLFSEPELIWRCIQFFNSALFLASVLLLFQISRIFQHKFTTVQRCFAVILIALYPMWSVTTWYAFSQNAFIPVFLLTFVLLHRAIQSEPSAYWLVLGLVSGFLYWVHPVALPVILALAITSFHFAWLQKRFMALVYLASGLLLSLVFYEWLLVPWLHAKMSIGLDQTVNHYPSSTSVLLRVFSSETISNILGNIGGHIFYLLVGSVGLVFIGLYNAFKEIVPSGPMTPEEIIRKQVYVYSVLAFLGVLTLSVIFFSGGGPNKRLDHWFYGRYVDSVLAPVLLFAFVSPNWKKILWALPVLLVCAVLCLWFIQPIPTVVEMQHIAAFWPGFLFNHFGVVSLAIMACPIIALYFLPRSAGMVLIAGVFLFAIWGDYGYRLKKDGFAEVRRDELKLIRDHYPDKTCVGFDTSGNFTPYGRRYWNEGALILYDYYWLRLTFSQWRQMCEGPLVSFSDRDYRNLNLRLLHRGADTNVKIWAKPK